MMPTLLSRVAQDVVIMAAYGGTSDTKVAIMMDLSLLWYPHDIMGKTWIPWHFIQAMTEWNVKGFVSSLISFYFNISFVYCLFL